MKCLLSLLLLKQALAQPVENSKIIVAPLKLNEDRSLSLQLQLGSPSESEGKDKNLVSLSLSLWSTETVIASKECNEKGFCKTKSFYERTSTVEKIIPDDEIRLTSTNKNSTFPETIHNYVSDWVKEKASFITTKEE